MKKNIAILCLFLSVFVYFSCKNKNLNKKQIENPILNPKDQTEELINEHYKKLLELHNKFRAQNDCANLELSKELSLYAQKHAEFMAKNKKLVHSNISFLLGNNNTVAENIAYNQKNENDVVNGWMGSNGHKKNILNKEHKKIGFGIAKSKENSNYWCAVFTD